MNKKKVYDKMFLINLLLVFLWIAFLITEQLNATSYIDSVRKELQKRAEHTEYIKTYRLTTNELTKLTKNKLINRKKIYFTVKNIQKK